MILRKTIFFIAALSHGVCHGFAPLRNAASTIDATLMRPFGVPVLRAAADDADMGSPLARNKARTCVNNFLTQRAVQSFIYLLNQCRDPHTAKYIEEFIGAKNLLEFHGTGAFNMTRFGTWDSFLLQLMVQPEQELTIIVPSRKNKRRPPGARKNRRYLQADDRLITFLVDINPTSLATRILSVRNQINKEWVSDLDTIVEANEQILSSYTERSIIERDEEDKYDPETDDEEETPGDSRCPEHFDQDSMQGRETGSSYTGPYSGEPMDVAFDRIAMTMLNSKMAFAAFESSPLRKGNFDLLYLLCTQETVHRVLRDFQQAGDEKEVSFAWLRDFYTDHIGEFFDGNLPYGRADDFLEELLLTPPAVIDVGEGKMGLIDTHAIAETILKTRTEVALEWKDIMERVPEDHMELQRALLEARMGKVASLEPVVEHIEIFAEGGFE